MKLEINGSKSKVSRFMIGRDLTRLKERKYGEALEKVKSLKRLGSYLPRSRSLEDEVR